MIKVREGESIDSAIKRFNDKVDKEGILQDYREHRYFIKPSQKRHEEKMRQKRKYGRRKNK